MSNARQLLVVNQFTIIIRQTHLLGKTCQEQERSLNAQRENDNNISTAQMSATGSVEKKSEDTSHI